jgi:hypothetical protein
MAFDALYRGCCIRCGEWFEAGTPIERDPDRCDWRHAPTCPELEDDKPTRFQGTTLDEMGF